MLMNVQGMLRDEGSGQPITDPVNLRFNIYNQSSGGSPIWTEVINNVDPDDDGFFNEILGENASLPEFVERKRYYLGITVGNDSEMTPRQRLVSVPFAITARNLRGGTVQIKGDSDPTVSEPDRYDQFIVTGTDLKHKLYMGIDTTDGYAGIGYVEDGVKWGPLVLQAKDGKVGIGTTNPSQKLEVAGSISAADNQILNVRGLQMKDWDDDTGGTNNKYRLLARDGAWQFYNGGVVVGNYNDGTWSDLANGTLIVEGKVGIGTTNPTAKLHAIATGTVNGVRGESDSGSGVQGVSGSNKGVYGYCSSSNLNTNRVGVSGNSYGSYGGMFNSSYGRALGVQGNAYATGQFFSGSALDIAEWVKVNDLSIGGGDVVVLDKNNKESMIKSSTAYSSLVAGIISTKPAFLAGGHVSNEEVVGEEEMIAKGYRMLALAGRVSCKVSTENGPIEIGDLLTTSSTPGHAMKVTDKMKALGAIVGKAMEPLASGKGKIVVLITLQ